MDAIIGALILIARELPKWIDELQRKGELTDEQANARRAEMQGAFASDAWLTDEQYLAKFGHARGESPSTDVADAPPTDAPPAGDGT